MPKFNILNHIPPFEETKECDRCGKEGSTQFEDARLCYQCTLDDVTGRMNEKID